MVKLSLRPAVLQSLSAAVMWGLPVELDEAYPILNL
jgi:hypothetical protein